MNVKYPTPQPCANCRQLTTTTKLYRLPALGARPLCLPCWTRLDALGMDWKKVA